MAAPALTVKLDDGTGTFPFDITSKVMALDGYQISRGRDDWEGAVTAGELRLTLNNSDGRFTPGSTILGTPSPITVDQRIQVFEGLGAGFDLGGFDVGGFDGPTSRFTGYVKSWPVSWPAVVSTFATVDLIATDAQARAERRILRSMLEEETLRLSPATYYPLSEAEGSTSAGDATGNGGSVLTAAGTGLPPVFGASTGLADDSTGVQFAGGQYLSRPASAAATSFGCVIVTTTSGTQRVILGGNALALTVEADGTLSVFMIDALALTSVFIDGVQVINDGLPHFVMVVLDGLVARLYIDGVQDATVGLGAGGVNPLTVAGIGGGTGLAALASLVGTVSHAFDSEGILSPTQADRLSDAALTGFAGESGTDRITRLAGYAGIPLGDLDSSLTEVPAQLTVGRSTQDAIQEVADAEFGLVFIDGSGSLTFHNRNRAAAKTAPDLTLDSQYVTPDVQPVTDDQQIVNYLEATAAGTGATSVAQDAGSEDAHGRYPISQTYLVQTDAEALDRASWIVAKQAEPTPRYGTLTINLYKMSESLAASVVDVLDLNCWLRVTSLGSQNPGGTVADVIVQGWNAEATAEGWTISCNVVSREIFTAWIPDDPIFGILDTYLMLF